MKKAELNKLRAKSVSELEKLITEKKAAGKSKNARREVAQILTIIKEAKLNENTKG